MSSSTSSSTSAISSSSPTGGGGGGGGGGGSPVAFGASSTLYLYTFLATLVLLLGVSVAIVLRSLVLRRRHRRLVEEAIRNGTFHPGMLNPALDARDRRWRSALNPSPTPAEKPALFEAHLGAPEEPAAPTPRWSFMPLSAGLAPPAGASAPAPAVPPWALEFQSRPGLLAWPQLPRLPGLRARRSPAPPPPPSATTPIPTAAPAPAPGAGTGDKTANASRETVVAQQEEERRLSVTVLIAMPAPPVGRRSSSSSSAASVEKEKGKQREWLAVGRPSTSASARTWVREEDEEGEVPDVVFGVAEVRVGPEARGL